MNILATSIFRANDLMLEMDALEEVRTLKRMLSTDPENEIIDLEESYKALYRIVEPKEMEKYVMARLTIRRFINHLLFSNMATTDCFLESADSNEQFEVYDTLAQWWLENAFRVKKSLAVLAFLEGRNLESFGVKKMAYTDVPQAIAAVGRFLVIMDECRDKMDYLINCHLQMCKGCPEFIKMYHGNTEFEIPDEEEF